MTPLERAARALCNADGLSPDEQVRNRAPFQHMRHDVRPSIPTCPRWETYQDKVRAVLRAIRDPGELQLDATNINGEALADSEDLRRVFWRKMIDAALEEG